MAGAAFTPDGAAGPLEISGRAALAVHDARLGGTGVFHRACTTCSHEMASNSGRSSRARNTTTRCRCSATWLARSRHAHLADQPRWHRAPRRNRVMLPSRSNRRLLSSHLAREFCYWPCGLGSERSGDGEVVLGPLLSICHEFDFAGQHWLPASRATTGAKASVSDGNRLQRSPRTVHLQIEMVWPLAFGISCATVASVQAVGDTLRRA